MRRRHIGTVGAGQFAGLEHQPSGVTLAKPRTPDLYDQEGNGWHNDEDEFFETTYSKADGFVSTISKDVEGEDEPFKLTVDDHRDYMTTVANDLEFDSLESAMAAAGNLRREAAQQEAPSRPFPYRDEEGNGWDSTFDEYEENIHTEIDGFRANISRDLESTESYVLNLEDRRNYVTSVAADLEFGSLEAAMTAASNLRREAAQREAPSRPFPYRDEEGNGWDSTFDEYEENIHTEIDGFRANISRDLESTESYVLNLEDRRNYVTSVAADLEFGSLEAAMTAASNLRREAAQREAPSRPFPYRDEEGNGWDSTFDEYEENIHTEIDGFRANISRDLESTESYVLYLEDRRSGLPVSVAEDIEFRTLEAAMAEASRLRSVAA